MLQVPFKNTSGSKVSCVLCLWRRGFPNLSFELTYLLNTATEDLTLTFYTLQALSIERWSF